MSKCKIIKPRTQFGLYVAVMCLLIFLTHSVSAREVLKLNENCTVNILNRAVQANEWGRFAMPNVPSFMGQVRARATCIEAGATISAQTDYFSVVNNDTIVVGDFYTGDEVLIPTSITFEFGSVRTIYGSSTTLPLLVTAQYADGSTADVTPSATGINYVASNPLVISVDSEGLVTALKTGTSLVTARKDGVIAVVRITVEDTGDSDGDGLPDSFEVSVGLDPLDPADAFEDQDRDGLSALEEFQANTYIDISDSDADGISDGEEVVFGIDGFITNPLAFDTDGDGLNDGLEVQAGTSPIDASSVDYSLVLVSLDVTPKYPVIIYNTIDGESSAQLKVTGTLIDGSTVNLTSSSSYTSSDLSVASFGITGGQVFAAANGTADILIEYAGFSVVSHATVEAFNPTSLSSIAMPGYAHNVKVSGNYAYVAAGTAGIVVVDVRNPSSPVIVNTIDTNGNAQDLRIDGDILYLADGNTGVKVFTLSDPALPELLSSIDTTGNAVDLVVQNGFIYVADGSNGIQVIDANIPSSPQLISNTGISYLVGTATGWTGSSDLRLSNINPYMGQYALTMDNSNFTNTGPGIGQVQNDIPVIPGQTYVLSGFIYNAIQGSGNAYLDLNDDDSIVGGDKQAVSTLGLGRYEFVSTEFVPTNSTVDVRAVFDGTINSDSFVLFDEVAVTLKSDFIEPTELSPGVYNNGSYTLVQNGSFETLSGSTTTTNKLGVVNGVAIEGSLLVGVGNNTLHVLNLLSPDKLETTSSLFVSNARDVEIKNSYAHIAAYTTGHVSVDLTNPEVPLLSGVVNNFYPVDVALEGELALFSEIFFVSATPYVNISSPSSPVYQGFIDYSSFGDYDGSGLDATEQFVYMTAFKGTSTRLNIGQLRITPDNGGIAPSVDIITPATDSVLFQGQPIKITINATDDIRVSSVNFLVNGNVVGTDNSAPYEMSYSIPKDSISLTISAIAVDLAGNIGTSQERTYTVDTLTLGDNEYLLAVESLRSPDAYPLVTRVVSLNDINDQFAIAEAARIIANEEWSIQGIYNNNITPPWWSAKAPMLWVDASLSNDFGYNLNSSATTYGNQRYLVFHTDEWASRLSHNICERTNNFGVISGAMSGAWTQCPVADWGRYYIVAGPDVAGGLVFEDDFEAGAKANWSNTTTSINTSFSQYLGRLGNSTTTLTLNGLPSHTGVWLSLDFYQIDSWDGASTTYGPDSFRIGTDRNLTNVLNESFPNSRFQADSTGLYGYSSWNDSIYRDLNSGFYIPHVDGSLKLSFSGGGLQSIADESWGLDNVKVRVGDLVLLNDFETGDLNGYTSDDASGGTAYVVTQGTSFSSYDTTGITFSGTYAVNVRSWGASPTTSIGILRSLTFTAGDVLLFSERSERTNVNIELRILDLDNQVLISQNITPTINSFKEHRIDTSTIKGQNVKFEIRQNTTQSGLGWYTLIDDVKVFTLP